MAIIVRYEPAPAADDDAAGDRHPCTMHVGLRVPPQAPSPRLRRLVERLVAGGVDSLWWPDHLLSSLSPGLWSGYPSGPVDSELHAFADPFVSIAALAGALGDVTVGVGVTDAIRRMPGTLAQAISTLSHVVPGGMILGLGAGEPMNYRPFGWDVKSPSQTFRDGAVLLRSYLDRSVPDHNGAVLGLRPRPDRPTPQLWLAAHGAKGLALTGQIADGWTPTMMDVSRWEAAQRIVLSSAVEHGRAPEDIVLGLAADVVVQDTHRAAHQLLDHPAIKLLCLMLPPEAFEKFGVAHPLGQTSLHDLAATRHGDAIARAARAVPSGLVHEQVIHGDPGDVAGRLREYPGLQHVRLSDLSGIVSPGGGTERLLAVAASLHQNVSPVER